jgi:hypothetical protein
LAEAIGERHFEGAAWPPFAGGMGEQPFEAGGGEFAEGELVGRFGPEQFGNKQGEMHGDSDRRRTAANG